MQQANIRQLVSGSEQELRHTDEQRMLQNIAFFV